MTGSGTEVGYTRPGVAVIGGHHTGDGVKGWCAWSAAMTAPARRDTRRLGGDQARSFPRRRTHAASAVVRRAARRIAASDIWGQCRGPNLNERNFSFHKLFTDRR